MHKCCSFGDNVIVISIRAYQINKTSEKLVDKKNSNGLGKKRLSKISDRLIGISNNNAIDIISPDGLQLIIDKRIVLF